MRMRESIRHHAFRLQYSLVYKDSETHKATASAQYATTSNHPQLRQDAYEVSMSAVLDIHYGMRSHNRVAPYVTCMQLPGGVYCHYMHTTH